MVINVKINCKIRAILIVLLSLFLTGCKDSSFDEILEDIEFTVNKIKQKFQEYPDVKERADLLIPRWENQVIDPEPILVWTYLAKVRQDDNSFSYNISLFIYDEDMDVLGMGITEEHISVHNQKEIIEELYPFYFHCNYSGHPQFGYWNPVEIRIERKTKNEKKWKEFVAIKRSAWADTVPPICVSIPEYGKKDVWVWIYDRQGNKSRPIKLLNFIGGSKLKMPEPYIDN